jgi:CxxC motif-containing protein
MTEIICIVCPRGCHLKVDEQNDYAVTGNHCPRGIDYGKAELKNPTRVISSTVVIKNAAHRRCPVKTSAPIPKGMIAAAMRELDHVKLTAPVTLGQVVVRDICGTGADFITTREMNASL